MKIIDRYILNQFFRFFLFALMASAVIFITIDLIEHLDKFIDAKVPFSLVFRYYYLYIPYIIYLTLPVAVLLATLFSIGGLVYRNEWTAMKSAGISLWRVLYLFIGVSIPLSVCLLIFGETMVPEANHIRKEMYRVEVRKGGSPGTSPQGRLYMQTAANEYLKMESFDPPSSTAHSISLQKIRDQQVLQTARAERMVFTDGRWVFYNVETRDFSGGGTVYSYADSIVRADIMFSPDDLLRVQIAPEEMNYNDLSRMIERLTAAGIRAGRWSVDLAFKISQPFTTVIIVLFGVPFAAYRRRGGLVLGFGLSLLVCFVYFGFMQTGKILGYSGTITPLVAAWTGSVVFAILGMVLFVRAPK